MANYIAILITGLLALIGIVGKTSTNTKAKHFHKLTPVGILVFILSLISVIVGIILQNKSDNERWMDQQVTASKNYQDSLKTENRFLADSFNHQETVHDLQIQKQFDSLQLANDSSRFYVTLNHFSEQLEAQRKTLTNVTRLLHPLFPMNVFLTFKVDSRDAYSLKTSSIMSRIDDSISQFLKGNKNAYPDGFFYLPRPHTYYTKGFGRWLHKPESIDPIKEGEFSAIDSIRLKMDNFMSSIIPAKLNFFIEDRQNKILLRFTTYPNGLIGYTFYKERNEIVVSLSCDLTPTLVDDRQIRSAFDLRNASLKIEAESIIDFKISTLEIACGSDLYDVFRFLNLESFVTRQADPYTKKLYKIKITSNQVVISR